MSSIEQEPSLQQAIFSVTSFMHPAEHPSPSVVFPSSHSSSPSFVPFPQIVGQIPQSPGQLPQFSPVSHPFMPQTGGQAPQSPGQSLQFSSPLQVPSPQTGGPSSSQRLFLHVCPAEQPQSVQQLLESSPISHPFDPQTGPVGGEGGEGGEGGQSPQSFGQSLHVSDPLQLPSPQEIGQAPQSSGQLPQVSPISHPPEPQTGPLETQAFSLHV
ncbi:MAG: hypothetical protein WCS85_00030 [Candidatus Peribacteraceae bacterium]|jgi:hypothetical protein